MRHQLMWLRSLTAVVLFLFLAEVNTWASTEAHLVLAVGYRALLITAPFFMAYGLKKSMPVAVGLGAVATLLCFWQINGFTLGLLALSMAVTGYLAKFVSSQTSQGAADNKVALNIGSLFSGGLLMLIANKNILLSLSVVMLAVCIYLAYKINWDSFLEPTNDLSKNQTSSFGALVKPLPLIGWLLIGVATGVKLTGIFTVLPQHLLLFNNQLPVWFGSLIMVNSFGVILVQHRVLDWLDKKPNHYMHLTALSSLIILGLPAIFKTEFFLNALAWVVLLTLGECALSRYDRTAKEQGYLFQKEIMVGVGSFATVALSRNWPVQIFWSGLLGVGCFLMGLFLISQPSKQRFIN